MFRLVKIKGDSMWPDYRHNDYVAISRRRNNALLPGDDVICRHAEFGLILKRIKHIGPNGMRLTGLNRLSAESGRLGNIQRRAVVGRVVWHIKRPRPGLQGGAGSNQGGLKRPFGAVRDYLARARKNEQG